MGRSTGSPDLVAALRASGHRVTKQRTSVLSAVAALGHATPEAVHAEVAEVADLSTVYRTLDLLEEIGLLQHTHLGHGSPTWSVAEDVQHVHLVCNTCGAVQEVDADAVAELSSQLLLSKGFELCLGHTTLSGTCAKCRETDTETT